MDHPSAKILRRPNIKLHLKMNPNFSATYSDARGKFLEACLRAHVPVEHHHHPLKGPSGELLATDVARVGPMDARDVLIVLSSTHGIEGYAGSGAQVNLLGHLHSTLGSGQAAVLVHAINPYGFAWTRRVNEDNVDLNRNFVDHEGGNYPENDLFDRLAEHIIPAQWDDVSVAQCVAAREAIAREVGEEEVRKAIGKGQYRHPTNVHFGGTFATWSNRTLDAVCRAQLANARNALLVDVHTGLGPYGYGELMTPAKPGDPVFETLRGCFHDQVHSTTAGTTAYFGSKGSILAGFRPAIGAVNFSAVGLEFGTIERSAVRRAVEAETWLHVHGDLSSPQGLQIKKNMRAAFYPEKADWQEAVLQRVNEVVKLALDGLRAQT